MTETLDELDRLVGRYAPRLTCLIAHLTDPHVKAPGRSYRFRGPPEWLREPNRALDLALSEVHRLSRRPDLIVLTGDLTESAESDEFGILGEILATSEVEILLIPGNHDRRSDDRNEASAFRLWYETLATPGLPKHPDAPEFYFCERRAGWEIVAIDTSHLGEMSELHRETVAELLGEPAESPRLVLSHSPLLPVGSWVDGMAFHDARFMRAFNGFAGVKAVLSGHVHKSKLWQYRGAFHVTSTALSYGIGDDVGYSLVGFGDDELLFTCRRKLPGPRRDLYADKFGSCPGGVVVDKPLLFENSPLCNPNVWPWRPDPSARG